MSIENEKRKKVLASTKTEGLSYKIYGGVGDERVSNEKDKICHMTQDVNRFSDILVHPNTPVSSMIRYRKNSSPK